MTFTHRHTLLPDTSMHQQSTCLFSGVQQWWLCRGADPPPPSFLLPPRWPGGKEEGDEQGGSEDEDNDEEKDGLGRADGVATIDGARDGGDRVDEVTVSKGEVLPHEFALCTRLRLLTRFVALVATDGWQPACTAPAYHLIAVSLLP